MYALKLHHDALLGACMQGPSETVAACFACLVDIDTMSYPLQKALPGTVPVTAQVSLHWFISW